jgi:hypothetical protein
MTHLTSQKLEVENTCDAETVGDTTAAHYCPEPLWQTYLKIAFAILTLEIFG